MLPGRVVFVNPACLILKLPHFGAMPRRSNPRRLQEHPSEEVYDY